MEIRKFEILRRYYILPVVSGVLLALTLPPFNISLFVWFGFVPLLLFAKTPTISIRNVFEGGLITGLIYAIVSVYPLSTVKAWWWFDIGGPLATSKAIFLFWVLFFIIIFASILFGLFVTTFRKFSRGYLIDAIIFAGLWTIFEYGRAVLFAGFTWGHIGYALYNETYILQLAYLGGVYALGFFIVFVNILVVLLFRTSKISQFFLNGFSRMTMYSASCSIVKNYYFFILILVIVGANIYGYTVIHKEIPENKHTYSVTVIQTGVETDEITEIGATHVLNLMRDVAKKSPDIVMLPENVFPFLFIDEATLLPIGYDFPGSGVGEFYNSLLSISQDYPDTSFVLGLHTTTNKREYNSMVALENGEISDIYNKRFLMPFSEGPLKWLPVGPVGNLQTGSKKSFSFDGKEVTPLICSEIIFPELVKKGMRAPIISIGNDSVFGSSFIAEENHIMARVRAAEHRVYLVRAMKTGVSSIIDQYGRVVSVTQTKNEEILSSNILY